MKKPKREMTTFRACWFMVWFAVLVAGIMNHDWYYIVGAAIMTFDDIDIVHWEGRES